MLSMRQKEIQVLQSRGGPYRVTEAWELSEEDKSGISGFRCVGHPLQRKSQVPHLTNRKIGTVYHASLHIQKAK